MEKEFKNVYYSACGAFPCFLSKPQSNMEFDVDLVLIRHGRSAANLLVDLAAEDFALLNSTHIPCFLQLEGVCTVPPNSIRFCDYVRSQYAPDALLVDDGRRQALAAGAAFARSHPEFIPDVIASSSLRRAIQTAHAFATGVKTVLAQRSSSGAPSSDALDVVRVLPFCAEIRKALVALPVNHSEHVCMFSCLDP